MSDTGGRLIRITIEGETRLGRIVLASINERSLMVSFDGFLSGFLGMMPLVLDDDGNYVTVIGPRRVVQLERLVS